MERGDSAQARRLFEDVTMPLLKQVQEILTEARARSIRPLPGRWKNCAPKSI